MIVKPSRQGRLYENKIIECMEACGHKILGIDRRPRHNLARGGWPDIISIQGQEVHVWEVKSGDNHKVHDHQLEVLKTLHKLGVIVHIIRYTNLDDKPKEEIWSNS